MLTTLKADQFGSLSSEELYEVFERCEAAISKGQADISDYETFVICQQEIKQRKNVYMTQF